VSKGPGVQRMFDAIAGSYDLMNRVMTLGQDQRWRRFVVRKAGNPGSGWALDLATGTGDIAALTRMTYPECRVIGADFSQNMLKEARKRFASLGISWQACDANFLPYADNSFESVSFGYLLRNVDDALAALKEVHRVLKPGGRVVCLDTTPPRKNLWYPFVRFYFRFGIPNRQSFSEHIFKEFHRSNRADEPLSVIMCDIDHFKAYNDTYGHGSGDNCLRQVAQTIKKALVRPGDFCARYGGEEFVIILTDTSHNGAMHVAEKIRLNVIELHIVHEESLPLQLISLSLGVATSTDQPLSSHEELLKNADTALYQAKKNGRNRVESYSDMIPSLKQG